MCRTTVPPAAALLAVLLCASMGAAQPASPTEGRGFALIVGMAGPFDKEGKFGVVPACVSDAVAVARVLARQDYYRGRIRLITLGVPESDRPARIDGVDWIHDLPRGEVDVRDALRELVQPANRPQDAARPEDMVLCYVTTHGTIEGGDLRLLMPGYSPDNKNTYIQFDRLVDEVRSADTQVAYVINSAGLGGGAPRGAAATYLSGLFRDYRAWRGVLSACQEGEHSAVERSGERTVFGRSFEKVLERGSGGGPITFTQLAMDVQHLVHTANPDQKPYFGVWGAAQGGAGVISRPQPPPPLRARALPWLRGLTGEEAAKLLPRLERADALRVVCRYAVDVGEEGGGVLTADDVAAIRGLNTLAIDTAQMGAWEADRYGASLTETERLARRKAWVQAIKEYVAQAPTDEPPPTAKAYYEKLAASGLPPVIRIVPYDPKQEPQETVPGLAPETAKLTLGPATPASTPQASGLRVWREAKLPLLVSASNPRPAVRGPPDGDRASRRPAWPSSPMLHP